MVAEMEVVVMRGHHVSALQPEAMNQLTMEVEAKEKKGQCNVIVWDEIKGNLPPETKVSPLAMITHKSRLFRAILDLSFVVRLSSGKNIQSVNETTEKTAPQGAIDQVGHSLTRIIHVFAEADDNATIFMAKWDIKDGLWRLDYQEGGE